MTEKAQYRRRVGSARPSHLMFTGGVGSLVDLPNFAVLVRGIDDWNYDSFEWADLKEPRLLRAVNSLLGDAHGASVTQLRPAPWTDGTDSDPNGPAARVGVPVLPFPQWLRCTACNELAALDSKVFKFENASPRRPDKARFQHEGCTAKRSGKRPLAVAARFVMVCQKGHLDDFPYTSFVHRGAECTEVSHPRLHMLDHGGNQAANVKIKCVSCSKERNIRDSMGPRGESSLPRCRGRYPHLATFDSSGCDEQPKPLVIGASNQWFAQTLSALAVPPTSGNALHGKVEQLWETLQKVDAPPMLELLWDLPQFKALHQWGKSEVFDAIQGRRATMDAVPSTQTPSYPDLRTPEWEIFASDQVPDPDEDFALRAVDVPPALSGMFSHIVQAERLREVRALVGFTRLDAPDPEDPDMVIRAPLSRARVPSWVPASEVRGEGIFLRLPETLVAAWEQRVQGSAALAAHRDAYIEFRRNRYSGRIQGNDDPLRGWPGARYIALHTLSHMLIRAISLECGYSSASLSERIYAGSEDDPRTGILIYTAVPDAEGTLGGLVSLAESESMTRIVRRALLDASRCSSDPLCAERLPHPPHEDFLHGAACHVCLFVSETTCERGNRFLDRRFIVPIDDPDLVLLPGVK
ncbi:DrmB family protein [Streptomyces sp. NPDC021093]|uniref:DrmB family protein n=1 Tax=Streptomyces sp. NPDC021093 TaxID=3365112 RepID=UPI00378D6D3F